MTRKHVIILELNTHKKQAVQNYGEKTSISGKSQGKSNAKKRHKMLKIYNALGIQYSLYFFGEICILLYSAVSIFLKQKKC